MRSALARTLYELAKEDDRIVVVVADISPAGAMDDLRREFPARFINVGVAEQSMIGLAAGLAQRGFRPFCYTIAPFALFRPYEFIRCDLAYQHLPVTIVGMGAGLSYPTLGGTHQAIEDVAVAMACPDMTVLAPCDPAETEECARWCASRESGGPVYLRIGKAGEEVLTNVFDIDAPDWQLGKMRWWSRSSLSDVAIVSYGPIMEEVLRAVDLLEAREEAVVDVACCSTLTEFSGADLRALGGKRVVVIEEASGFPLAGVLREILRRPVESICLPREFSHVHGTRKELLERAGLTAEKIVAALS